MPPVVPSAAQEGAALLMRVFDQARTEKRFDEERTLPPDGKLMRDEFPSARFGAIDALVVSDGAINEAELAAALARLHEADQKLVLAETKASVARMEAKGQGFTYGFAGFVGGGAALMGGLLLGGGVGLVVAGLGAVGLLAGFGLAIAKIIGAGREGKRLFDQVETTLGRAGL